MVEEVEMDQQKKNPHKSPILAGLLSILFLGGGGQFYLGYYKRGIALIALTIIFAIFGVGFGGLFPLCWGILDALTLAWALNEGRSVEEFEKIGVLWIM
jgi:TM2 domain-containing membrane protein YozV